VNQIYLQSKLHIKLDEKTKVTFMTKGYLKSCFVVIVGEN